ncbi:CBS domain-containing protein [Streptomyces sp. NPDC087866]|uniref:CBS domain-containing protein n=1 Tax=Streptomyces sp. NPDC087866 TaxID=3365815 RepID=UPI003819AC71
MTLVRTQPHPANTGPVPRTALEGAALDATDTTGLQVGGDMTVEVALSVMISARTGHLRVCDNDGLCTGLVTRAQLAVVRDGPAYSDRLQLRDILGGHEPYLPPVTMAAEYSAYVRRPGAGDRDHARGVLAPASAL